MSKHTKNIMLEKINNMYKEYLHEQEIEDDKMENDCDLYDTNDKHG